MLILDPKMPSFSHFRHNKNFSLKSKTFAYIYSCLSSGTILEKSTNRVRENIKHVKFGPKIAHLTHFRHEFSSKITQNLTPCKISGKRAMRQSWKNDVTDGRATRRTNNAEFIWPYGRGPTRNKLRILAGKKHGQIKLQRPEKVRIWALGLSVH